MGGPRCAPPQYTLYYEWERIPVVLNMNETCNLVRFTRKTVVLFWEQGLIKGGKLGGEWRFDRDSIREFLSQTGANTN